MSRSLDATCDAIHHLAWLAVHNHDEQAHGGLCCTFRGGKCPDGAGYDKLSTVSADCDPGAFSVAKPADYLDAACDLLNLAAADEKSAKRATEIRVVVDMLADLKRRCVHKREKR